MPHDLLQIALGHHRAGRLTRAEAGYRALLAEDPEHADALHWLGVLLFQAGQLGEAVTRLQQAVARRPDDPAFLHNLAQAYLAARRDDEAIAAFQRSRAAGADAADLHFGLGIAWLRKKRPDEAIAALRTALTKNPNLAPAYYHLAAAYRAARQPNEVRKALLTALELDGNYAAAWQALGVLDREAGNHAQAAASLRKAQELRGGGCGGGVSGMQPPTRSASSMGELERRLTPDDSMRKLHDVLVDAVGLVAPTSPARAQVAELFDRYAEGFDAHLRDKLGYRVPEMIADKVGQLRPQGQLDVLDLGCGTGLCGTPLRPLARTLAGVDLSAAMIEKARARGVYDRLEVAELVEALCAAPHASFDLLVAGDVLNYIGDLAPTMEAATAALRRDGLFIFSVEALGGTSAGAGDGRFQFRAATHRYAHAEPYLRHVAGIYGFDAPSLEAITIRNEANSPVNGYLVTLQRC
jgi:predicted TPR repeat methyltransferase